MSTLDRGSGATGWERPGEVPPLGSAEVHVWLDRVPADPVAEDGWRRLLTRDELATADRLRFPERRSSYVRGRWLLRSLVSAYVGADAGEVVLTLAARGKPRVVAPPAAAGLEVSLSRSGRTLALAVGRGARLGVDVEEERPTRDLAAVAERVFADEELAQLEGLEGEAWTRAFYRGWSRKEAVVKTTGEGLSMALQGFAVSLGPLAALLRAPSDWPGEWTLLDLAPGQGCAGALAALGPDPVERGLSVRRLVWSDALARRGT